MTEKEILVEATKDFESNMNYMDFVNKYFGIGNIYIPKDKEEREKFIESDTYKAIQAMRFKLEEKQPSVTEPEFSGKLNFRMGTTLHKDLAELAAKEGISLNQLILSFVSEKYGEFKVKN